MKTAISFLFLVPIDFKFNRRLLSFRLMFFLVAYVCLFAQVQVRAENITNINTVLSITLKDHPSLRAREAEINAAQSEVDAARWQYWPTPSLTLQVPNQSLVNDADKSIQSLTLKQPLWTGGRLDATTASSIARLEIAQASREEVLRDITLDVIQAYGDAYSAGERVKVYEKNLNIHQRLLEQIRRRAAAGLSAYSDTELAKSRYDIALADLYSARVVFNTALENLHALVGSPIVHELQPLDQLIIDEDVDINMQDALQNDPTLFRMRAEARELNAQAKISSSALQPDLYLNITQRYGDVTGNNTQMMLTVESKFGAGLSNFSSLKAARQREYAKLEDINYRTRKFEEQIRSESLLLKSHRNRVQAYKSAFRAADLVYQSWDRQYFAGKKTWQEVMNSARENAQTEVQLVDVLGETAVSGLRLAVLTRGVASVSQLLAQRY